jgi:hypothetical protein
MNSADAAIPPRGRDAFLAARPRSRETRRARQSINAPAAS